jgi:hypothetical protein
VRRASFGKVVAVLGPGLGSGAEAVAVVIAVAFVAVAELVAEYSVAPRLEAIEGEQADNLG